jgi:hypothetical protein
MWQVANGLDNAALELLANTEHEHVSNWFKDNKLTFHPKKVKNVVIKPLNLLSSDEFVRIHSNFDFSTFISQIRMSNSNFVIKFD